MNMKLEEIQKHLQPQHDRIIVEREPDPKKTDSGIVLPVNVKEMEMTNLRPGRVVAVGPGRWDPKTNSRSPMTLKVNDRVMFHKHAGESLPIWGRLFQVMGDGDVGVVLQDETPVACFFTRSKVLTG